MVSKKWIFFIKNLYFLALKWYHSLITLWPYTYKEFESINFSDMGHMMVS